MNKWFFLFIGLPIQLALWGCHHASAPGETGFDDTEPIDTSVQRISTDDGTDAETDDLSDRPTDDSASFAIDLTVSTETLVDSASEYTADTETSDANGRCGNGVLDPGEVCDDGNTVDNDACSSDCATQDVGFPCVEPCEIVVTCGDGILDAGEGCEDGNTESGDGCTSDCQMEPGYACPYENFKCYLFRLPRCGDGKPRPDLGEACDDGNTVSGDGCEADCSEVEAGFECPGNGGACISVSTTCGDGVLDWDEACDDSNTRANDGCDADCMTEPGYRCLFVGLPCLPVCGDGIVSPAEQCDDGNANDEDACNSICEFTDASACKKVITSSGVVTDMCVAPLCGNGIVEVAEACDLGSGNSADGYGCTEACQFGSVCGDGHVDGDWGEQCDEGWENNDGAYGGCTPNCTLAPRCGDGKVHPEHGELCDAGDDFNLGGYGECAPDCTMAPHCGDGIVQDEFEECDEGNDPVTDGHPGDTCYNSCRRLPIDE